MAAILSRHSCVSPFQAFNYWLKIAETQLHLIGEITQMLHNASLLWVPVYREQVHTVQYLYNAGNFLQNTHNNHPIACPDKCQCFLKLIFIPSASTKLKGGYTGFILSVCPSVDRIMSVLYLQQYSSYPFHICTSNFRRCNACIVCFKI